MPLLYIMCGLSFSGKTTLARAIANATESVIVSYDELYATRRDPAVTGLDEWYQLIALMDDEVRGHLAAGRSVVVDNLNEDLVDRDRLRGVAEESGADAVVVFVDTPPEVAVTRLRANERTKERGATTERHFEFVRSKLEPPGPPERCVAFRPGDDLDAWLRALPRSD